MHDPPDAPAFLPEYPHGIAMCLPVMDTYWQMQLPSQVQLTDKQPLLLLPESGGAWLKACYDAEKDVILMDEETQQKARSKFLQTYEGNMVVSGEGADIWYQRLWRSLEPAHYEEIIAQTQRYLLPLYRYHRSTQI